MNSKTKNILIAVLLVGIISMTIAYASLSQVLNINGTAQLQNRSASWNIHFVRISNTSNEIDPHGYASVPANSTISLTDSNTTATLPMVTLNSPGDYVDFYFDVINEGDITGYLNIINNINIPSPSYANNETLTSEQRTALETAKLIRKNKSRSPAANAPIRLRMESFMQSPQSTVMLEVKISSTDRYSIYHFTLFP